MDDTDVRVVLVNAGSQAEAETIARTVVAECLAACGNIYPPIQSVYRWQGKVEEATEVALILKTTQTQLPTLIERVRALHSYEVPEIIALPVVDGLADYLDWVKANSQGT